MTISLPEGFSDLDRVVPAWAHDTEQARNAFRVRQSQSDLRDFYDTVLPRLEKIASYLDGFPLDRMPSREATLLRLALMAMEVAPAIEYYGRPDVPHSVEYEKFEILPTPARYRVAG